MASPAPSASSTQGESQAFVQQSDDEEQLWEVIEITNEKASMFKVRWKGDDPETGRPWAQSWVPKSDVTDDLKKDWKRRQKEKAARGKSKQPLNSRVSTSSNSTITGNKKKGRSLTATASGSRPPESKSTTKSISPKKTITSSLKRNFDTIDLTTSSQDETPARSPEIPDPPEAGPSRPRKRQKVSVELPSHKRKEKLPETTQESFEVQPKKKFGKRLAQESTWDDFQDEVRGAARVIKVKDRMKKKSPVKQKEPEKEKFLADLGSEFDELDEEEYPQPTATRTGSLPKDFTSTNKSRKSSSKYKQKASTKPHHPGSSEPVRRSPTAPPLADETPLRRVTPDASELVADNDLDPDYDMELTYPDDGGYDQADIDSNQNHDQQEPLFLPGSDDGQHLDEHSDHHTPSPSSSPPPIPHPSSEDDVMNIDIHEPRAPKRRRGDLSEEVPATQSQDLENVVKDIAPMRAGAAAEPELEAGSRGTASPPSTPDLRKPKANPAANEPSTPRSDPPPQSSKPLLPVPQMSPSVFYPHLPPSVTRGALEDDEIELDNPPSTIEYFTSSDKPKRKEAENLESITSDSSQRSDTALKARRQDLVEQAQRGKGKARMPFGEVLKGSDLESQTQTDQDLVDESRIREMEDRYVDLDGGGDLDPTRPVPQEEEESTQDLELERQQHWRRLEGDNSGIGVNTRAANGRDHDMNGSVPQEEEESTQDLEMERRQHWRQLEGDSSGIGVDTRAANGWGRIGEDANPPSPTNSAPSAKLSDGKSQPTSKKSTIAFQDDRMDEEFPPTLSPPHHSSPDHRARNVSKNNLPSSPPHGLDNALSLLNVKSEEIAKLEAALSAERQQRAQLDSNNRQLQDALASAQERSSQSEAALAAAVIQLDEEKLAWNTTRTLLEAQVDSLTQSKERAETDSNFFREQYAQASGFVGSIRSENAELEKRALVAEGQAKDGVAMIRATYEGKVKGLQGEIAQWKGLALLLQEKDRRTGDDIRKKAAQEPELRAQVADLVDELERLEVVVDELSRDRTILKRRSENGLEMDGIVKVALPNGTQSSTQDSSLVYRCLWRPGNSSPCYGLFDNPEELELHMFNDQHMVVLEGNVLAD